MCNGGGCLINPNGGGWRSWAGAGEHATDEEDDVADDGRLVELGVLAFTRPTSVERFLTMEAAADGPRMLFDGFRNEEEEEVEGVVDGTVMVFVEDWVVLLMGGSSGWWLGAAWSLPSPDVDWRLLTLLLEGDVEAVAAAAARQEENDDDGAEERVVVVGGNGEFEPTRTTAPAEAVCVEDDSTAQAAKSIAFAMSDEPEEASIGAGTVEAAATEVGGNCCVVVIAGGGGGGARRRQFTGLVFGSIARFVLCVRIN